MTKLNLFSVILIVVFMGKSAFSQHTDAPQTPNKQMNQESENMQWILDELIVKWTNNRDYCIEMIEAMPDDGFNFVPSDSIQSNAMMTFWEQAVHIATTLHWQMEKLGFNDIPEFNWDSEKKLITSYENLFDYLIVELENMDPSSLKDTVEVFYGESTKRRLLNLMDNHVAHHRGQMIVYLRMKGIKPPKYRGW